MKMFSDNSCWNFEADDVFVVWLQRPMHEKLNFWINFKNFEWVSVDISFAFLQWTRFFLSCFVEKIVAGRLSIDPNKGEWEIVNQRLNVCPEMFN